MEDGVEVFDLIEGTIVNKHNSDPPDDCKNFFDAEKKHAYTADSKIGLMTRKHHTELPAVVPLNVGGVRYMTLLSTLRKYPDSMLAAMFSGRHDVSQDDDGHYFIDTNGTHFCYILDYLRHESLPPENAIEQVYKLATYFGIQDLVDHLQICPKIAKMTVHHNHIHQFPNFDQIKAQFISLAMKNAVANKIGEVVVHPFKQAVVGKQAKHNCIIDGADIVYGPWKTDPDEEIFIRTLENALKDNGFCVTRENRKRCKNYSGGVTCQKFIYKMSLSFI